jgi:hypothetical protein
MPRLGERVAFLQGDDIGTRNHDVVDPQSTEA